IGGVRKYLSMTSRTGGPCNRNGPFVSLAVIALDMCKMLFPRTKWTVRSVATNPASYYVDSPFLPVPCEKASIPQVQLVWSAIPDGTVFLGSVKRFSDTVLFC